MNQDTNISNFLPTSKKEMDALGWEQPDIILFTGDAYIDHPSFGAAVVARVLEKQGFNVAIVPQPNWRDDLRDFKKLGTPRLFFAVTSGCMDSMVNHYTANKRLRSDDAYTAGGKSGNRPDYAVSTYSKILRSIFPDTPIVIGGVEASLRRFAHYDYWADKLLPSIMVSSDADLLVYGMGEKSIVEIAQKLDEGYLIKDVIHVPQTARLIGKSIYESKKEHIKLNHFDDCLKSPQKFGENFKVIEEESNKINPSLIIEPYNNSLLVVNPPYAPSSTKEMDSWWDLPYMRAPHPRYKGKVIPAWEMIKFSVNIHRGCFGGCSFCTISAHQGKFISSRSPDSIINEVNKIIDSPDFKGYLSDLGGPSANMYMMQGKDIKLCEKCKKPSCIYPKICSNLNTSHKPLLDLYRKVREIKGIKKVTIGSGLRYDLFANQSDATNREYLEELFVHHVSGRLKVAPEHTEESVLKLMRKPNFKLFLELKAKFDIFNRKYSKKQQLIPYFISSHPGCTNDNMRELTKKVEKIGLHIEQVQDFTPTPMTLASTIFYTGTDPYSGKSIFVERTKEGKIKQREHFFWYKKPKDFQKRTNRRHPIKRRK
ncbi:MAG: YgiQ family radical SAM protein [Bacteroidales bacterium]